MTDTSSVEAAHLRGWTASPEALEERGCELCASDRPRELHIENGFRIVRCRACGHVYVNPRPTRAALTEWYPRFFEGLDANGIEAWHAEMRGCLR